MKPTRGVLVAGTTSDAGKSFVATGLCRILAREGERVQPFKAVNMSLNSIPADDGGEIAVAQWVQSVAAGVPPLTVSNPVLLKSEGPGQVEVIIRGISRFRISSWRKEMGRMMPTLRSNILQALEEIRASNCTVVAEGAGSPVEMNLKDSDLANFFTAESLGLPVILVADLERGGAIAQVIGTMELLSPSERKRVKGVILNRMRGDRRLLDGAVSFIEGRTGVKVIGVLPWLESEAFHLPAEDSLSLPGLSHPEKVHLLRPVIGVLRYPHMSNYLDLALGDPSMVESLRWIDNGSDVGTLDALILPGSRRTRDDLDWMVQRGLDEAIVDSVKLGLKVGGVCGGYQMLGESLSDPEGFEGFPGDSAGLGLLPIATRFEEPKIVRKVIVTPMRFNPIVRARRELHGFEIRRGRTVRRRSTNAMFELHGLGRKGGRRAYDGAVLPGGQVWGSAVHGLLSDPATWSSILRWAGKASGRKEGRKPRVGLPHRTMSDVTGELDRSIDHVANMIENNVDMAAIDKMIGR